MTLDEVIKELCTIRAAYRSAENWQVCIPESLASDSWVGISTAEASPELAEVQLS